MCRVSFFVWKNAIFLPPVFLGNNQSPVFEQQYYRYYCSLWRPGYSSINNVCYIVVLLMMLPLFSTSRTFFSPATERSSPKTVVAPRSRCIPAAGDRRAQSHRNLSPETHLFFLSIKGRTFTFIFFIFLLIDWLIDWLDWLNDLIDWMIWLIERVIDWLIDLIEWFDWSSDLIEWFDWSSDLTYLIWLVDLIDWVIDWFD